MRETIYMMTFDLLLFAIMNLGWLPIYSMEQQGLKTEEMSAQADVKPSAASTQWGEGT
jgi:hypothetical protein